MSDPISELFAQLIATKVRFHLSYHYCPEGQGTWVAWDEDDPDTHDHGEGQDGAAEALSGLLHLVRQR